MKFKTYKQLGDCKRVWNRLSDNDRLFDVWDYRQCFYDRSETRPNFIVGKENGSTAGLIPLAYDKTEDMYIAFGDWFPERNRFFLNNKRKLAKLLKGCPDNTVIDAIDPDAKRYYNFSEDEYTYYLDLARYNYSFDRFFGSFDKKKQKNFRRDLGRMPKFKVYRNRTKDFKRLVQLNIRQFDGESIFNDSSLLEGLKKMMRIAQHKRKLEMLSVEINGKVEGVDIGIRNGLWYTVVTGSSNNSKIPNLGKLMNVLSIKNAIAKRSRYVDFLASSDYWKNQWNFEKAMLLKYEK